MTFLARYAVPEERHSSPRAPSLGSLCCLLVVLARSMAAVEAFATLEAFVAHHLEASKGGELGFTSLEKSAAGRFFAKLPRSVSRDLGLSVQARVPGAGHSTAESACRRGKRGS